jgi:hypothetical protein
MGYTHYWYQKRDFTREEWKQIAVTSRAVSLISTHGADSPPITIRGWDGTGKAQFTNDEITFNGDRDNAEDHETFRLNRVMPDLTTQPWRVEAGKTDYFASCKTAQKPYDILVCAVLLIAKHVAPTAIDYSSDGDKEEWRGAELLANKTLPPVYVFNPTA